MEWGVWGRVGRLGWRGVECGEKMNSGCDAKLKNRINTVWHGMNAGTRCWHDGNSCNKQIRHTTFFPRCADFNYVEATPRSAESSRVLTSRHAWGARNAHAAACNLHRPSPFQSLDREPSMRLAAAFYCSVSPNTDCTTETHTPHAHRSGGTLAPGTATQESSKEAKTQLDKFQEGICAHSTTGGPPRLADSSVLHASPAASRSPHDGML